MEQLSPNDIQEWQRADNSKGGKPEAAPYQVDPKTVTGPKDQMNSKIAKPTYPKGGMVC
jgi:hypothetical protein